MTLPGVGNEPEGVSLKGTRQSAAAIARFSAGSAGSIDPTSRLPT